MIIYSNWARVIGPDLEKNWLSVLDDWEEEFLEEEDPYAWDYFDPETGELLDPDSPDWYEYDFENAEELKEEQ